jgi:ribosomal protein S18 acetylase RimI-like enzyme
LSVYAANAAALGLYASLGFVERERLVINRAGEPDEKIIMCLSLDS